MASDETKTAAPPNIISCKKKLIRYTKDMPITIKKAMTRIIITGSPNAQMKVFNKIDAVVLDLDKCSDETILLATEILQNEIKKMDQPKYD